MSYNLNLAYWTPKMAANILSSSCAAYPVCRLQQDFPVGMKAKKANFQISSDV